MIIYSKFCHICKLNYKCQSESVVCSLMWMQWCRPMTRVTGDKAENCGVLSHHSNNKTNVLPTFEGWTLLTGTLLLSRIKNVKTRFYYKIKRRKMFFLRFLFCSKTFATFFLKYFCYVFLEIKNVDNSNVPVSKLCTWNVVRTLVLLLEWCDRTP